MARKSEPIEHPANPLEAFRELVHAYGAAELAPHMGTVPGVLYNKANAGDDTHNQPTLRDVMLITQATNDMRVIDALNTMFDRAAFDITPGPVSDEALLELLCIVGSEAGQMQQALHKGFEDGRFCQADLRAVRGEAHQLITAVLNFVQRLEGLVDD